MKLTVRCDWCGRQFDRHPATVKKHNFCCRQCLADFSNKRKNPSGYASLKDYTGQRENMAEINRRMNPSRMTIEVRQKLRQAHLQDEHNGRTYAKFHGRHEHRLVAESLLGRKLKRGEVVHHIDGDKRNNHPENLMVMTAVEHNRLHMKLHWFWFGGGDLIEG